MPSVKGRRARQASAARDPRDPLLWSAVSGAPCSADDDDGVQASWTAPTTAATTAGATATANLQENRPAHREARKRSSVPELFFLTRPDCCSCGDPRFQACSSHTGNLAIRPETRTTCPASFQVDDRSRSRATESSRLAMLARYWPPCYRRVAEKIALPSAERRTETWVVRLAWNPPLILGR